MILLLTTLAHAEGPLPEIEVEWSKELGLLVVDPPPGEHLAPDAPVTGSIQVDGRHIVVSGTGASVVPGIALSLPGKEPRVIQGTLNLSLCEDDSSACRPVDLGFIGTIDGRKGSQNLGVHVPVRVEEPTTATLRMPFSPDQAFQRAQAEGKLVLLDFGAVWCPPCNELSHQVLHDPENAGDLEGFVVAEIDVDRPESWPIKDRYEVGGYPTVIVARPDGTAIDRVVGYAGEQAFLSWLAEAGGLTPLDELLASDPQGAEASRAALRAVRDGRDEAAEALFEVAEDNADLRIARIELEANEADLAWLIESAPGRRMEWVWASYGLEIQDAEVEAALLASLREGLVGASAVDAASLLNLLAARAEGEAQKTLYAAAARTLHASFVGQPLADRPYVTWLADLYRQAGMADEGFEVLKQASGEFPHEFTFFYAAAGLLEKEGRLEEALPWILAGQALAYGDQRLRAGMRHAEILHGLERDEEALAVIEEVLAEGSAPAEELQVRTHRYRGQLEELKAEISAGGE